MSATDEPADRRRRNALRAGAAVGPGGALAAAAAPLPRPTVGTLERLPALRSAHVAERPVDVWRPRGVDRDTPCAVLYVHDGQMLFDASSTWNHQSWQLDVALQGLIDAGRIAPTMVVAVWNRAGQRYAEYFPQKALALAGAAERTRYIERAQQGRPLADAYLRFVVDELRPAVARRYATRAEPAATAVMGSSMGGLISLYALCEYPQVFGAAAALSTHWVGRPTDWGPLPTLQNAELPLALMRYLHDTLPEPATHRLYMDHGTVTLDALYDVHQRFADLIVRDHGYTAANYASRVFDGAAHDERSWAARVHEPLAFVLGAAAR